MLESQREHVPLNDGGEPDWAATARPVLVLALASAVAIAVFASQAAQPWNGVLQRAAVTLAVTAEAVIAARLLTLPPPGSRTRPATALGPAHRPARAR